MFLPVGTESVVLRSPAAVWGVMAVTVVTFLLTWGPAPSQLDVVKYVLVTAQEYGAGGESAVGYVTYLGLHAGWMHLIGNMWMLGLFGVVVCGRVGTVWFLAGYVLMGAFAGVAHDLMSSAPGVGASGAVNGLIGMYLVIAPQTRIHLWWIFQPTTTLPVRSIYVIAVWFVLDLIGALSGDASVAYGAHLGGFAAGVLFGLVGLKLGIVPLVPEERSWPERRKWTFWLPRGDAPPAPSRAEPSTAEPAEATATTEDEPPPLPPEPPRRRRPRAQVAKARAPSRPLVARARSGVADPSFVRLDCDCGWAIDGPRLFMGDGVHCRKCGAWLAIE